MFTVVASLLLAHASEKIEDGDFDGLSYDGYTGENVNGRLIRQQLKHVMTGRHR